MSIEGRIAVDASFSDLTTGTNLQSLMRLALTSTDSYTSGKVALVTGTCGTATVSISLAPTTFRDSSGSLVSFTTVTRLAFAASASAYALESPACRVLSSGGRVGVSDTLNTTPGSITVYLATTATASYSLLVVGT